MMTSSRQVNRACSPPSPFGTDTASAKLSKLLLRHPELVAEAEEITSALLVVENDQEFADEITARLRCARAGQCLSIPGGVN
jgi:hypothetical protein